MKAQVLTKETILNYGVEKRNFPVFGVGDTIEVAQIVRDGEKERVQLFQGDVICMREHGIASTFTVRKIGANNVGVERILPYYSQSISEIKIIRKGKVRRAKLRYLRARTGRAARVEERVLTKEQKSHLQDQAS